MVWDLRDTDCYIKLDIRETRYFVIIVKLTYKTYSAAVTFRQKATVLHETNFKKTPTEIYKMKL